MAGFLGLPLTHLVARPELVIGFASITQHSNSKQRVLRAMKASLWAWRD